MKNYSLYHGEDAAFICDCWEICLATFVNYPSVKDINNILQGKSEFCSIMTAPSSE